MIIWSNQKKMFLSILCLDWPTNANNTWL